MGLVAGEFEKLGITSVAVQLLKEVAIAVKPPRALFVPFKHGYPLDQPNNPDRQKSVIMAALHLLERDDVPVLVEYTG